MHGISVVDTIIIKAWLRIMQQDRLYWSLEHPTLG
jgi:hypothetical protein